MKTDETSRTSCVRQFGGVDNPCLPLIAAPILIALAFVLEALVHLYFFDGGSLAASMWSHSAHEWWMRVAFVIPLVIAALLWRQTIIERNTRMAEIAEADRRLRELNSRLARGEGLQRGELAARLHEHVAQTLSAAGMYLSVIDQSTLPHDERMALRSAGRTISRVMSEVREIAQELKPTPLEDFGLRPAVESMARRVMGRTGTSVEVEALDSWSKIEPDTSIAVYQVVCELVETAAGNPLTSTVRICSEPSPQAFTLQVDWDATGGEDLVTSEEWLRSVGGTLRRAQTGNATSVSITVPAQAA